MKRTTTPRRPGAWLLCIGPWPVSVMSAWLGEVDAAMPTLAGVARMGNRDSREVSVSMDGEEIAGELDKTPIPVDPGEHSFRFEAPGQAPIERRLSLSAGEKNRKVELDFP